MEKYSKHYLITALAVFISLVIGLLIGANYLQQSSTNYQMDVTTLTATEISKEDFNDIADLIRTDFKVENYIILEDFSKIHEITYVPTNLDANHGSSQDLEEKGLDRFYSQIRAINYYNEQEDILIMMQITRKPTANPRWTSATLLGGNQVKRMNLDYKGTPIVFYSFDYYGFATNLLIVGTERNADVLAEGATFLEQYVDFLHDRFGGLAKSITHD